MDALAQRQIVDRGTPESTWQRWGGLCRLPVRRAQDLVPATGRAVVIAPHPDDELLAAGGLMMQWQAAGRDLLVIAVTDGGASHAGSATWTPQRLARRRRRERRQGLQALGMAGVSVQTLGMPDGQVAHHTCALTHALGTLLRPGDAVFTTWRLDGHPDHEATGLAAHASCQALSLPCHELPVWMWHWASPDTAEIPWHRAVAVPLTPEQVRLKQAAIAAHQTQIEVDDSLPSSPILPTWALARLLRPVEIVFI